MKKISFNYWDNILILLFVMIKLDIHIIKVKTAKKYLKLIKILFSIMISF